MVVGRRGGICSGQEGGFGNCDRWFWGWVVLVLSAASLVWAGGDASLSLAPSLAGQRIRTWCAFAPASRRVSLLSCLSREAHQLLPHHGLPLLLHVFTSLLCSLTL